MKENFFRLLAVIAKRCNTELTSFDLNFFNDELCADWTSAYKGLESFYKKNYGRPRLPSPYEIQLEINPIFASESDIAQDIVGKIVEAIRVYGYPNPHGAMHFIGEVGWTAVDRCGGWSFICRVESDQLTFLRSQLRDCVKSLINVNRDGLMNQAHSFKSIEDRGQRKAIADHQIKKFLPTF